MDGVAIPSAEEESALKQQRNREKIRIRKRRGDGSGQTKESAETQNTRGSSESASASTSENDVEGESTLNGEAPESTYRDEEYDQHNEGMSKKDDDRIAKETLTENVFSLIYTAPVDSAAFWMGILVSLFQITMPSLALLDLIVFSSEMNPLQVPNGVSLQVRIIGAMALILGVSQYWDFMEAIEKLEKGPPPSSVYKPPGASHWKFYLAYTLQFTMGSLFHMTIFTLVVQSTTVIGMFLNFAALEFIVLVDDVAFALAKRGYFTNSIKEYCDEVSETVIIRVKGGRVSRRIQIFAIATILLGMYGFILHLEWDGRFDCNRVEVQFGDGFITLLPVFSGIYYYERDFHDERPVFWDKNRRAAFRYCANGKGGIFSFAESGYWVFNILSDDITSIDDMCRNYISRSPNTKGYDILEQPANTWLTKHRVEDSVEYNVDYFSIRCADCDPSTCNGECVNYECVCAEKGRFGTHCQFTEQPCEETDFDRRTSPFSGAGLAYSSDYYLIHKKNGEPAYAYHRPIYYYMNKNDEIDILMNLGRRYFLFYLNASLIDGFDNFTNDEAILADYLENIHPFYDWIQPMFLKGQRDSNPFHVPVFVSDPIDIGTATDNVSPLGLSWARVNQVQLSAKNYVDIFLIGGYIDTVLLCAWCSETSPCLTGGKCDQNHTCHCTHGHVGRLCEADCWESPDLKLCPRCFSDYESDDTCAACYADSEALDCPNCKNDPFAADCMDCFANFTAPGCKGEARDAKGIARPLRRQ